MVFLPPPSSIRSVMSPSFAFSEKYDRPSPIFNHIFLFLFFIIFMILFTRALLHVLFIYSLFIFIFYIMN